MSAGRIRVKVVNDLTDGEMRAFRNFADKHAGNMTASVNIADARQTRPRTARSPFGDMRQLGAPEEG